MPTIRIQPYEWGWNDDPTTNRITAKIWALDEESNAVLVRVPFEARCAIELPYILGPRRNMTWTKNDVAPIIDALNNALSDKGYSIAGYAIQSRKKFYYFRQYPVQFLILQFYTQVAMKECAQIINRWKAINVYGYPAMLICREHDVDPTVNLRRWIGTTTTQWIDVTVPEVELSDDKRISTLEREYHITSRQCITPLKDGTVNVVTSPRLLSFDIECYSANHNKLPDKYLATDVVYTIACCFQRYRKPETRKRIGIVLGKISDDMRDKINAEIIETATEQECIQALIDVIKRYDPEILMGHNIFGFDYPYIDARIQRCISHNHWGECSRIRGKQVKLITNAWESSAYGRMETNFLDCEGRISFDLLPYFKRNMKLDNYRLETIARTVIGEGKNDMPVKRMFRIYQDIIQTSKLDATDERRVKAVKEFTEIVDYALKDAELPIGIFDKRIIWLDLLSMAGVSKVTPFQIISRGLGVRGYNMIMHKLHDYNRILDERKTAIPPFDGGFVGKPKPGIYDNVICLDFKSLYPSIIIAFNLCSTTYIPPDREKDYNLDHCWVFEWESDIKEQKKTKTYNINDLLDGDVDSDDEDSDDEEEGEGGAEVKTKQPKKYKHRYVFYRGGPKDPNDRTQEDIDRIMQNRGILPLILQELIDSRDAVKAELKIAKTDVEKAVLSARELALKVTANSMYGVTGTEYGKTSCVEVALCTTYIGRTSINNVNKYLREKYNASIVYNDTDSTMFTIPGLHGEELMKRGAELADEISREFAPLKIEFEKAGRMLAICPKKYVYWKYDKKGNVAYTDIKNERGEVVDRKPDIMYKGVVATRRDNSPWLRKHYKKILDHILNNGDMEGALDLIYTAMNQLTSRQVPIDDLVVTKQLRAEYKSATAVMAVFSSELQRIGNPVSPGERLPFVVVKDKYGRDKIGYKMRLLDLYLQEMQEGTCEPIDYEYYIEKGFMKPIQQLIEVAYGTQITEAMERNKQRDLQLTFEKMWNANKGKYRQAIIDANNTWPNDIHTQLEWLTTQAPGKTALKKIKTKYYTRWLQPDLRTTNEPIKNYLRYRRLYKDMLQEMFTMLYNIGRIYPWYYTVNQQGYLDVGNIWQPDP